MRVAWVHTGAPAQAERSRMVPLQQRLPLGTWDTVTLQEPQSMRITVMHRARARLKRIKQF
jgi:hypothetical protein